MTPVPVVRPARGRRLSSGVGGSCPVFPVPQCRSEPGSTVEDPRTLGVLHRIPTGLLVALLMAALAVLLLLAMRFDPMVDRPVTTEEDR